MSFLAEEKLWVMPEQEADLGFSHILKLRAHQKWGEKEQQQERGVAALVDQR
jgi:hypothetical protein